MKVTIRGFTGMRPQEAVDLLKPGEAALAVNTLLIGGDLSPLNQPLQVTTLSSSLPLKAMYRYAPAGLTSDTQYWFQSSNEADFVRTPIDGDTEDKVYFTGVLSYPAKTKATLATATAPYPTNMVPMGVAQPDQAPSVSVSGTATNATDTAETVVYVVTLVNDWGEEGPPSPASNSVSWKPGQTLTVTLPTSSTPSYPGNTAKSQVFTGKRLYRSATGSSGTARFLLVNKTGDIPLATTSYTDTASTSNLGSALSTTGWREPPDSMVGLTAMGNGIMAGFFGNTVCFCEPYAPSAWPTRYQQSVDDKIVGIAAFDQSLLVSTTRGLWVMTGSDPSNITSERLAVPQACVSKRSMVKTMGGVAFATPDGLGYVGPGGFKMLSQGLLSRREWRPYAPSSMHGYESDGSLVMFFDNGSRQAGLVFRFDEDPSFCEIDFYATTGFRDPSQDALYLCGVGSGATRPVLKWEYGTACALTWESSEFRLPAKCNMCVARVEASGPVSFSLIADGAVKYGPITVSDATIFKLPAGYRSNRYRVRLGGTSVVRAVEIATAAMELSQ